MSVVGDDAADRASRRQAGRPHPGRGPEGIERLEQIPLTSRELSRPGHAREPGALSPLEGFMNRHDYERVVEEMRLARGLPWALPVCLAVDRAPEGDSGRA